ncbi:hypothetical protein DY000_02031956 [Brassica cretica]|uniref:Uncharacterized protein n=1 Tax=Brassica cretica TaxID=69181 RepID=A0ABQ7DR32_BRACR|nr:hypothetical protein DY000_02031956 [Brassica cretica]
MIWRRWDPGIGQMDIMGEDEEYLDDYGEWHRRSSPDTGVMDEGNRRNSRKRRILGNWGQISMVNQILIINKTKSQISEALHVICLGLGGYGSDPFLAMRIDRFLGLSVRVSIS